MLQPFVSPRCCFTGALTAGSHRYIILLHFDEVRTDRNVFTSPAFALKLFTLYPVSIFYILKKLSWSLRDVYLANRAVLSCGSRRLLLS